MADIFDLIQKVTENSSALKRFVSDYIRIIVDPRNYVGAEDPSNQNAFMRALGFGAFISVLNFLIWSMLLRVDLTTLMLLTDTLVTYLFWITYGAIYYWTSRAVGGKANWYCSVSAFLYLTAYFPLMSFVSVPHENLRQDLMSQGLRPGTVEWGLAIRDGLLQHPLTIESASWLLGRIAWLIWLVRMIQVSQLIHRYSYARAIMAVLAGFLAMLAIQSTFQNHVLWLLWNNWKGQ